jgi:glycosyltransferase involved in cell wall biosynthesis
MYIFLHFINGHPAGGVERYGRILAQEALLREAGSNFEIDLRNHSDHVKQNLSLMPEGTCIAQYSMNFHETEIQQIFPAILAAAKQTNDHRLFIHDANSLPFQFSSFWSAKLYLKPRTLLSTLFPNQATRRRNHFLRQITKSGCRCVVFSESQKHRLPAMAKKRAIVAPHFVEKPEHSFRADESKERLGLSGKLVLTVLGWLNPRKQNENVINALPYLPKNHVVILAGGPLASRPSYGDELLELATSIGVHDRVRITGYLNSEMQCRYIAATDVALCVFRQVSASGSISTWIAHDKPIVASRLPELEIYNRLSPDALIFCDDDSPESIAALILKLETKDWKASEAQRAKLRNILNVQHVWEMTRDNTADALLSEPRKRALTSSED